MRTWLVRAATIVWAGFWLWFAVASGIHDRLPWHGVVLYALHWPVSMIVALVPVTWFWPRLGGVLLILAGFVVAAWYALYYGHMPTGTKLFVLSTMGLPPLVCGLILLLPAAGSSPK